MSQEEDLFEGSYFARIDYSQRVFDPGVEGTLAMNIFRAIRDELKSSYGDTSLFGAPLAQVGLEDPHEMGPYPLLGRYQYVRISPEQDLDGQGIKRKGYIPKDPETRIYFKSTQPRPLKNRSFENDLKPGLHMTIEEPKTILSPAIITMGQIIPEEPGNFKTLVNASNDFSQFAGDLNRMVLNLIPEDYNFGDLYGPNNLQVIELPPYYFEDLSMSKFSPTISLAPNKVLRMWGFDQPSADKVSKVDCFGVKYELAGPEKGTILATK